MSNPQDRKFSWSNEYCAGEQKAFDELYRMSAPRVHGIILARVPRDEVEDIVRKVLTSALNCTDFTQTEKGR